MNATQWNTADIPDQTGRVAIITGATSGIGKETARALANKNATVILAVRNLDKANEVVAEFKRDNINANVLIEALDLGSLVSIADFGERMNARQARVDLLINNAGIMMCPFATTADGFEIQFGTNHLGHFALTGHLLPLLQKTPHSRLVNVSSLAHQRGNLDFSDLNWSQRKYNTGQAYCDSKLANLLFTFELARRLDAHSNNPLVTAAHPGWTKTDLQRHKAIFLLLNLFFAQKTAMGALPTLRAAIDSDASPADYFGPGGKSEMKGFPIKVEAIAAARDNDIARRLWAASEQLTGVSYDYLAP